METPKKVGTVALSMDEEIKIVSMLARGDLYKDIMAHFEPLGRGLSNQTILNVKKRNKENIEMLREKLMAIEEADALSMKRKANKILKNQLDYVEEDMKQIAQARKDFIEGNIDYKKYRAILDVSYKATIPEIVNVSKEMHQQSRMETPPPAEKPKDIEALRKAIESGDEVILNQMIFNKKDA